MLVNCDFVRFANFSKDFIPQEHPEHNGYYIIPFFEKLIVAKDGSIMYKPHNGPLFQKATWKLFNNSYYGFYYTFRKKVIVINRITLLAMMFLPKPDNFLAYSVELKDPDKEDELSNIEFVAIKDIPEFSCGTYNKKHRDFTVDSNYEPVEHPSHPGYYIIPGFDRYIYNPTTMVMLNIFRSEPRQMSWSISNEGYRRISLISNSGHRTSIPRHRLVGMLFLRKDKDLTDLTGEYVINHKNGIPGDDRIENLEWVTYQDNTHHAIMSGKVPVMTPVQVRNIDTDEVLYFPSILSCARYCNMSRDQIIRRIDIGHDRIFPERLQYRRCLEGFDPNTPWPDIKDVEKHIATNTNIRKVLVHYCLTDEVVEYESSREVAAALNIGDSTICVWLNEPGQLVHLLPDNKTVVRFKYAYDDAPWRPLNNIYAEISETDQCLRQVIVHNTLTDQYKLYRSAKDCAKDMNLLTTTLNWRLKSNGTIVYKDGCTYRYFDNNLVNNKDIDLVGWLNNYKIAK